VLRSRRREASFIVTVHNALPSVRDEFLNALDVGNRPRLMTLATYLVRCDNRLPSGTCMALGLPPGSCYSAAAQFVLNDPGRATIALAAALPDDTAL
jgi:hypothetical protein